jgi:hypothetical protein
MNKYLFLATAVSILWTFFKTAGFFEMRRLAKLERLFQALEIGVSSAWQLIVKPWLLEHPDEKKLPEEVRNKAERHALKTAAEVDSVVHKFDAETVLATLKAAVEEAKRRGGK